MIVTNSVSGDFLSILIALVIILFGYWKWTYQYWQRKNLHYLEPQIPFGNISDVIRGKENFGIAIKRFYKEMRRRKWKHGGIYALASPNYLPVDLDYIKNVMTKDFQYFTDRLVYYNEKKDPLNAHLVNLGGSKWRNLRTKLTPTFTSGKMKMMFQTLADCRGNLVKKLNEECVKDQPIDIKEILACFTTDIIGSCAFGLDMKSFEQDNSPFRIYGKKVFNRTKMQNLIRTLTVNFPNLARYLDISITPPDITDFFINAVKDTVNYREKNYLTRNDFMQLLIEMKNNNSLEIEEVAAQSFAFFLGGFETSSTLMTFALYELSKNQNIQQKLRNEVNEILRKHGGNITYESIQEMKYMNQVIDETLRMYPPAPVVNRECVKDYKVPDEDLIIEKGTTVIIPIIGIHYDEEYYPDPEKFDPERFNETNKNSRHSYAHIPFGEGPRICIGMRFGLMQAKVGLTCLLKNYNFTVNKKTQEPLKIRPSSTIFTAEGEVWLNAQKL